MIKPRNLMKSSESSDAMIMAACFRRRSPGSRKRSVMCGTK
eukprot:CAMPEP_0172850118 /NCGR_PEP_ID=MMETSP1075-20121228/47760_1 /TAXON_ID=2916 /ORGANISM="Ceratium fusus, Strain PA161109" /LENGTH=40 /DNA_ID= /DNA_START= /DNA_END= /DNA_ORIENTATION=